MQNRIVFQCGVQFGCDPELFFSKENKVVGAEKVIATKLAAGSGAFVLDGVQVELNPLPGTCRAEVGNDMARAFRALRTHLMARKDGIKADFSSVVEVEKAELDSLSDAAKVFGCARSLNAYNPTATVMADPNVYLKRSAGGHIHLGLTTYPYLMEHRKEIVPLLDVLLGNTCVLIDRDPNAAERRKNYGRAGEYRLPKHGLEYRTLSNFWLRAYPLMSFVMATARLACSIAMATHYPKSAHYEKEYSWPEATSTLLNAVDLKKVERAINENDLTLAKENFEAVKAYIVEHCQNMNDGLCAYFGLWNVSPAMSGSDRRIKQFEHFAAKVQEQGLEYWFPEDPLTHWCNLSEGHECGWESFCNNRLASALTRSITGTSNPVTSMVP